MFAPICVSSARARNARLVIVPRPGIVTVPFITPSARPWPTDPGLTAMSMMLLPLPRGVKLVPPMTRARVVLYPVSACHWMPNSAALSADDLDDQRLDEHLGAADVELLDDRAEVVVHGLGRHDHERVARGVGGDRRAVRRERRRARERAARTAAERSPGPESCAALIAAATVCGWRRTARRAGSAPLSAPVSIPRSVCATRAASAFFR